MRDIKFRAYHEGKMFYSDNQADAKLLGAKLGESCIGTFISRFYGDPTLSQYTGLKDKNEVDIYEGDVVSAYDHPTDIDSAVGVVFFNQGCFDVTNTIIMLRDFGPAWTEVIGNIYENPELLASPECTRREIPTNTEGPKVDKPRCDE